MGRSMGICRDNLPYRATCGALLLLAAGAFCALAGCEQPAVDPSAAADDRGYAILDDPMQVRVAAGESADGMGATRAAANGHSEGDEPTAAPRVAFQGVTFRPAGVSSQEMPAVGTADEFITRLAAAGVTRLVDEPADGASAGDPVASADGQADGVNVSGPTASGGTGEMLVLDGPPPGSGNPGELIGPQGQRPAEVAGGTTASGGREDTLPRLQLPGPGENASPPPPLPDESGGVRIASRSGPRTVGRSAGEDGTRPATPGPGGTVEQPAGPVVKMSDRPVSGAMVEVGQRMITVDEVLRPIWDELDRLAGTLSTRGYQQEAIALIGEKLRAEVSEELVLREAERGMTEQTREAVDQTIGTMIREQIDKAFGGSERLYRQRLREKGLQYEQEMTRQRRKLLVQSYLREKFMPQVHVTRPEAFAWYQEHIRDFTTEPQVDIRLIQVSPEKYYPPAGSITRQERLAAEAQAKKQAEWVLAEIRSGKVTFEEAAKKYSDGPLAATGGMWGTFRRGGFRLQKVEERAFAMKEGEVSDVLEDSMDDSKTPGQGRMAYFIVMSERVGALKVLPFSEAQKSIMPKIETAKLNDLSNTYMAGLFEKAGLDEAKVRYFMSEALRIAPEPRR